MTRFTAVLALIAGAFGTATANERLQTILDQQPPEVQARYAFRNPVKTLEFFGIEPGMTVLEALPGGGWYTRILVPYLGADGKLIEADYSMDMWPRFSFVGEEFLAERANWVRDWTEQARAWQGEDGAEIEAFVFGSMPEHLAGTADAVLFIRALHNLARFEEVGSYLSTALAEAYEILKPGGIVGVVQHEARVDMPDDWADGSRGYLKKSFLIERFEAAGFEFVAEADFNANPKDRPTVDDIVWRLPPSLATSGENPELRAEMEAIGESNRMTLKFRKPASE
ncbi:MAG: methyltransferase [Xanthomonadales bacterium]|nr:methyltransferase [Xanthomonadales bacterium]